MTSLEQYFEEYRNDIIGNNQEYESPYGIKKIIYGDWIASGRLHQKIEDKLIKTIGPFVANTHTETSETGTRMTYAYHLAQKIIKQNVNANSEDVIISAGFGMTAVVNKFQRILGLKDCIGRVACKGILPTLDERPVVFITHMEHHSNHTSWYETNADIVMLKPDKDLLVDLNELKIQLEKYKDRPFKIGTFTACSNVTGIRTPYHKMAKLMHEYGGLCFVDFAASAPYDKMDMHPENKDEALDAVMFSPHKFLGGPGSSGVLIFNSKLYKREVPDHPGGGTVDWTNPWGNYKYIDNIETREDGGTPGFLQTIKTALCFELKNKMGIDKIRKREEELVEIAFDGLKKIDKLHILADNIEDRLGVISFYVETIHYNLFVKILSDRFGIQVRGGCACAGTYGHFLLEVKKDYSNSITEMISHGDLSEKPGWVRLSLHPTMTNNELHFIIDAIEQIVKNITEWEKDYIYKQRVNEFYHKDMLNNKEAKIGSWFDI